MFQRKIGEYTVVVQCLEDLAIQATALLSKLEQLHSIGPALRPGTVVQFGWSRLTLELDGNNLIVCEPDYDGDPFHHTVPVVDRTLRVIMDQAFICRSLNSVGREVTFDQTIVVAKAAIDTPKIYLDRVETEINEFSGWYLGPTDGDSINEYKDQVESLYVYQLLNLRPAVMKILNLPFNCIVIFNGDTIETIFDSNGIDVSERIERRV